MGIDPSQLGVWVLALCVVVHLATDLVKLFGPRPTNGAATDVTRREYEELKAYTHESMHEVRNTLQAFGLRLERLILLTEDRRQGPADHAKEP